MKKQLKFTGVLSISAVAILGSKNISGSETSET